MFGLQYVDGELVYNQVALDNPVFHNFIEIVVSENKAQIGLYNSKQLFLNPVSHEKFTQMNSIILPRILIENGWNPYIWIDSETLKHTVPDPFKTDVNSLNLILGLH
jgi:hypothetical protein